MSWKLCRWVLVGLFVSGAVAQDLLGERIRKIEDHKQNAYFAQGIFHNGDQGGSSAIKALRHAKHQGQYERLVIDFNTSDIPRIYGHMSEAEQKLYLDFFKTKLLGPIKSFGKSEKVNGFNFFPVSTGQEMLSLEISFKKPVKIDVFYLLSPGRLVIDLE
ncbi:MAG: hypothetical protein J6Y94_01860 [Bacteriovoracaceae bacterium]|nr:hypothetical protein [Bacteriovoracaceae bacterium]